jgi:shikimate kinase
MTAKDTATIPKMIVLVGLMGAGKTCIGIRLAARLGLRFVDADVEIEQAAGGPISDIFERYGETSFRDGEQRVIARLLDGPVQVLATGGGAYLNGKTRAKIRQTAISIWLRADLDLLLSRVGRRDNRPMLKEGEPREVLKRLMDERYPVYADADIVVESARESPDVTVDRVQAALWDYLARAEATEAVTP